MSCCDCGFSLVPGLSVYGCLRLRLVLVIICAFAGFGVLCGCLRIRCCVSGWICNCVGVCGWLVVWQELLFCCINCFVLRVLLCLVLITGLAVCGFGF